MKLEWQIMSKIDASAETANWQNMQVSDFKAKVANWEKELDNSVPEEYKNLRQEVVAAYKEVAAEVNKNSSLARKKDYYKDLKFAIQLYRILNKYGFSVRMASNDQVWFYLCVKIFPDIVNNRYPGKSKINSDGSTNDAHNINEERFWKTRRRIYLKVLWWYIYLSVQIDENGQEDFEKTYDILKDNSTDEIVQLVERSGSYGYRVDVYREILRYYAAHRDKYKNDAFRKVMVLNTAKTVIVEPDLIAGGVQQYVKELFEFVSK